MIVIVKLYNKKSKGKTSPPINIDNIEIKIDNKNNIQDITETNQLLGSVIMETKVNNLQLLAPPIFLSQLHMH